MHEFFDHTADLGLRVTADTWPSLLEETAACLFAAVVEDASTVRPTQEVKIVVAGVDREFLLFDWLRELLRRVEMDGMLFSRFQVTVTEIGLIGSAWGEPIDRGRHLLSHEVKAITYHGLSVTRTPTGWMAEVIVDI
jgi:SHS2 domain-containing protein